MDFQNKENPLTALGVLFSVNQILYLLIAMWVYPTIPDKMLMVLIEAAFSVLLIHEARALRVNS